MGRLTLSTVQIVFLDLAALMAKHRLAIKRVQFVYPKAGREANIVLVEAIKDGQRTGMKVMPGLMTTMRLVNIQNR